MKNRWWLIVLSVMVAAVGGGYMWLRVHPPMEVGVVAQNAAGTSVLVEVTNHGWKDAKVTGVTVNGDEAPDEVKMEVSNLLRGYAITDGPREELPEEISFENIGDVRIKAGPTNAEQMDRLDDGTATKEDRIYAVNVFHDEKVRQVQIEYQSLGMTYRETVYIE
ncbi:hypothetical protein [Rossellomorea sp. KS-H15a]|uniref:hypothetical protein n=1 Tax=Rossellomorea sp. KS-H15a TaxID=2963940 RepID=UPI0020C5E700|nr:hypothetical protein [Rossellomorea sp. KS-H15a]UTE78397.1 hypothetical protein M1J35_06410 [Rossellomorea sp. KS-H15a]